MILAFTFQGLFRNYGDCLLPLFRPHIERLISDTSHDKHDSNNRCAMEIISGLIRGSKHWSYEQVRHFRVQKAVTSPNCNIDNVKGT